MTDTELVAQVTDYITSHGHDPKWIPSLLGQARVLNIKNLTTVHCNISFNKQGGVIMSVGINPITAVEESKDPKEEER